jgi:hypothetical protein
MASAEFDVIGESFVLLLPVLLPVLLLLLLPFAPSPPAVDAFSTLELRPDIWFEEDIDIGTYGRQTFKYET